MTIPYNIFPGFQVKGAVAPAVQELAIVFNLEAINALNSPVEGDLKWSDIAGVTPGVFEGKIPLDFTSLDGFEEFKGVRTYKQIEIVAIQALVNAWQRNLEWDIRLDATGNVTLNGIYNTANYAQSMIRHARVMKARLVASVFMLGTPGTNKAKVYAGNDIPGAGLPLFSTDAGGGPGKHFANPTDPNSRRFANYFPAFGKFDSTTFASTRRNMRAVPSPALSAETLGVQVTDIIGPSHMEEPFRQVALANLVLQAATVGGTGVAAAVSNIYTSGMTPTTFHIAPQLDADPYLEAYKAANPGWTPDTLPHMWIAVSRTLIGARPVETVAPTKEFTPRLQLFGDGSEMAATTRKVHLLGDLDAGAAPGVPHVAARYEET